jgi:peroxiredoxin Q/BCP
MRDDWRRFQQAAARIVVVLPHGLDESRKYWRKHDLPYLGVPDPDGRLARMYDQQWKLIKLGRMPALFVIAPSGRLQFVHYSDSMSDIPSNDEVLEQARDAAADTATPSS